MSFNFNTQNLELAKAHISKYPEGRSQSALLPLLDMAQRQNNGWLSQSCLEYIGEFLGIPAIKVHEVASFYSMFNLKPVGKFHVQVCGTTPCMLCGAEDIRASIENELGISVGETTPDGLITLSEVECLGACVNAPVVQVNDDLVEDLDKKSTLEMIQNLKKGNAPKHGSVKNRQGSKALEVRPHA